MFMGAAESAGHVPITLEEWADLDEDEPGEVVDGFLVEEEMPSLVHEVVVMWLGHALVDWGRPRGAFVLGSEWKLAVSKNRGRKADVVVYLSGTHRPPGLSNLGRTPPDIVIEVVTARPRDARRDRVEKMDDYANFGVRYYWLVDPQLRSLEVFELTNGRYSRVLGVSEAPTAEIPGLEGLVLHVADLWAAVERAEST